MTGTAAPPTHADGGPTVRAVLVPVAAGLMIGTLFVLVYLAAFHDPRPHQLPVAVVGSAQAVDALREASDRNGDPLEVRTLSDRAQAQTAVASRAALGALVLGPSGPELLVAGANGPTVTATLQGVFAPVAAQTGEALVVTDLAPLVAGDSRGLSVFYAAFGVVLAAFLFGLTSMQVGSALTAGPRLTSAVAFSVLMGLVVAAAITAFDALPAPFLVTVSVVGLLALAVGTTTATLLRVLGPAGIFVSSVGLLIVGNATSTGILPAQFLPGWLEPLTDLLPVGVAVRALRGAAYFDDDGLATGLLVLAAWVLGALAVYAVPERGGKDSKRTAAVQEPAHAG